MMDREGYEQRQRELAEQAANEGDSRRPTGRDWTRAVSLGLGLPVALSLVGPIYYGHTHGPYWRVVVWASACTVIFCWQERSSFRHALSTAPPSVIGRLLLVLAIVVMAAAGFLAGDTLVYLIARALHVDFRGRYFPANLILVGLFACSAVWLAICWHRSRQNGSDPYKSRIRQAAKFGWKQTAEVPEDGFGAAWAQRSIRFARNDEEAVLWHKDATITLLRVPAPFNFDDFVELEGWIKKNTRDVEIGDVTGEVLYFREIEKFVTMHGHHITFLETQITDVAFFMGYYKLSKEGYAAQQNPRLIAGLTLEALTLYPKDRDKALRFLSGFADDVKRETPDR